MPSFNKFNLLPFIPYNIIKELATNKDADAFWQLLNYPTYDALSRPKLTMQEKLDLIWKNESNAQDYKVFLTDTIENMMGDNLDSLCFLKIWMLDSYPVNRVISTVAYEFDILYSTKISMVECEGYPCRRGDAIKAELMKILNGCDVNGIGMLSYDSSLSRLCRSRTNIGNDQTFTGVSIVMATQVGDIEDGC